MSLPFSREQFFDVFAQYNQAVWPAQLVLAAIAVASVALVALGGGRVVGWGLALLWTWMGVAYHIVFFSSINPAAWGFGLLSLIGAALFAKHSVAGTLRFERPRGVFGALGLALVAYALVGYPAIGAFAGHAYPRMPTFGLPCPTTIFTLGMLVLARRTTPATLFFAPLVWVAIGSFAAFQLGVVEDYGLLVAGLVAATVLLARKTRLVFAGG